MRLSEPGLDVRSTGVDEEPFVVNITTTALLLASDP
jgi:hypothetical protein